MDREELKQAIVATVNRAGRFYLRRKQIAVALGYTKSPHLISVIEELVEEGKLFKHAGTYRRHDCWYYCTDCKQLEQT